MDNNTNLMTTATQPSFVAPSVVAVRLRAAVATHGAANAAAVWTKAASAGAKVCSNLVAAIRAIRTYPGPIAWSPPTC